MKNKTFKSVKYTFITLLLLVLLGFSLLLKVNGGKMQHSTQIPVEDEKETQVFEGELAAGFPEFPWSTSFTVVNSETSSLGDHKFFKAYLTTNMDVEETYDYFRRNLKEDGFDIVQNEEQGENEIFADLVDKHYEFVFERNDGVTDIFVSVNYDTD
jgi:hypothetical protein